MPVRYKAAIMFPLDSDRPKLIWLRVNMRTEFDSDNETVYPEYHHWETPMYHLMQIMKSPSAMPTKKNGQKLNIYMGDHCFGNDPITKSLLKLNAGYDSREFGSIAPAPWAGNLIVVNITKKKVQHPKKAFDFDPEKKDIHNDANMSDLRYAFDYLTRDNRIFESDQPNPCYIRKPGIWCKAVKICCDAEMKLEGKKNFTEIAISRYHPMFTKTNTISSISKHMGFPIHVQKTALNPNWLACMKQLPSSQWFSPFENIYAVCLMIDADVDSKHWKLVDERWDKGRDSTVLVARKDLKDLTVHQVEALAFFSKDVVQWEMGVTIEAEMNGGEGGEDVNWVIDPQTGEPQIPTEKTRLKFIKKYLQSNKFAKFFEDFKQKKIAAGDATWADATVPPKGSIAEPEILKTKEERNESLMRLLGMF